MATNDYVHLKLAEAQDLADLTGIEADLSSSAEFARSLLGLHAVGRYDLTDALTTAILVRYARAFTTGARLRLGEDDLRLLSDDQRALHERICAIRNKHAAH